MSDAQMSKSPVQPGVPAWDAQKLFLRTRLWLRLLIALLLIVWLTLIGWVFIYAPITKATAASLSAGANLTIVLAPVIAASAAVERTLESLFNVIEGSWRSLVAYLGRGLRWLRSAETELKQARQFLADVSEKYSADLQSIQIGPASVANLNAELGARMEVANRMMSLAQQRLEDAESNLASATSSDSYVSAKAAASIVIGLLLGVIVAAIGQLQMFAMMGIGAVPARIDVFITGLVIGSGSYPVHSLVGLLQQGKDALDSVNGYYRRRVAPAIQAVQPPVQTVDVTTTVGETSPVPPG